MKVKTVSLLIALFAINLGGCGNSAERPFRVPETPAKASETPVMWGEPKDGVSCGITLSKEKYHVGENVVLTVYLKSTRPREFWCNVDQITSWRRLNGSLRMRLLVDATRTQFKGGKQVYVPPSTVVAVLTQEFLTQPSLELAIGFHFNLGRTPINVICWPMFLKIDLPTGREKWEGPESGSLTVEVIEQADK